MQLEAGHAIQEPSALALCIQSLTREGRALVSIRPPAANEADALPALQHLDSLAREELALELPEFSAAAALWGGRIFQQLCRFIVCRDIGAEEIEQTLRVPCPGPRNPPTDWSVDLTLRHLGKLSQLARHLSNADPLIEHLRRIAAEWPLSSVGMRDLGMLRLDSFAGHPGLRRLYADRILAVDDESRLGDSLIDNVLRADIGIHHELAPAMARKLFPQANDTH